MNFPQGIFCWAGLLQKPAAIQSFFSPKIPLMWHSLQLDAGGGLNKNCFVYFFDKFDVRNLPKRNVKMSILKQNVTTENHTLNFFLNLDQRRLSLFEGCCGPSYLSSLSPQEVPLDGRAQFGRSWLFLWKRTNFHDKEASFFWVLSNPAGTNWKQDTPENKKHGKYIKIIEDFESRILSNFL